MRRVASVSAGLGWGVLLAGAAGLLWSVTPIPREKIELAVAGGEWRLAWDAPRWLRAGEAARLALEVAPVEGPAAALELAPVLAAELHVSGAIVQPASVQMAPPGWQTGNRFEWSAMAPVREDAIVEVSLRLEATSGAAPQVLWGRTSTLAVGTLLGFSAPAARLSGLVALAGGVVLLLLTSRVPVAGEDGEP